MDALPMPPPYPPARCPPPVGGLAWSPAAQTAAFEVKQSPVLQFNGADSLTIVKANPARLAFYIFLLTDVITWNLVPAVVCGPGRKITHYDGLPIAVQGFLLPGIAQMEWSAFADAGVQCVVYEYVSLY